MKIENQIVSKCKAMKINDRIDWERVRQFKRQPGKQIREALKTNHFVILGSGNINNFEKQPLVVLHLNDYLGQLISIKS
jgi:hypothetical protein